MTRAQRLTAGAAAVGLTIGIGAAVAIPRGNAAQATSAGSGSVLPGTTPFVGMPGPVKTAAARPSPSKTNGVYLRIRPGTLHEEIRERDPAGGPDWVLRRYVADRIEPVSVRHIGTDGRIGSGQCAQLGREVDGQFGWIDGDNTFRPVSTRNRSDVPTQCFSSKIAMTHQPDLTEMTLLGNPRGGDPYIRGSVVWGIVGKPVIRVSTKASGEMTTPKLSPTIGAFLQFYGPDRSAADVELRTQYATGSEQERGINPIGAGDILKRLPKSAAAKIAPVDPSTVIVAARAPDPAGGPSWGVMAAKTTRGSWCTYNSGYVVDGRVGLIDPTMGQLVEEDRHRIGCSTPEFTKRQPIFLGGSFGAEPGQSQLEPARGRLRLQAGRSSFYGLVDPNADLVTITTSRDVRSIVPTSPAHAIIAVYDGVLQGDVTFSVHMKDGTVRTFRTSYGF